MKGQVAIPASSEELEELLNDDGRMGEIQDSGQMTEFIRAYQGAWKMKNTEAIRQFREQAQVDLQDFMRDQASQGFVPRAGFRPGAGAGAPSGPGARRARMVARSRLRNAEAEFDRQSLFNPAAIGAAKDIDESPYAQSLQRFLWATLKGENVAAQEGDAAKIDEIRAFKGGLARVWNSMSERVPSDGGFLVPENLRSEILAVALEEAVMRPRATIIPMDSLRVPLPAIDDTDHTASVYGGVAAYWTAEGAALSTTAPKFSRILLEAAKLTAYTEIPNELLQDSVTPLDAWFNMFFPRAVAFFEDVAFITGDGVNQPEGVINAPGAVRVPVGTLNHIKFGDIAKAFSRLWPASMSRAIWVCAPDVLPELLQLAVSEDGSGTTVAPPGWLGGMQAIERPGGGDGGGANYTLMGLPLRVSEKIPALAGSTAGSLTLFDPSYYLIGDRQAMQVATSEHYKFGNDVVAYRVIERLDGRMWLRKPITPANGSTSTLSTVVKIDSTATS